MSAVGERRTGSLALLALVPVAVWFVYVLSAWALAPPLCDRGTSVPLHAVSALALVVGAAGVAAAARFLSTSRAHGGTTELGTALVFVAVLFTAGIALFWVFAASFDPCW